MATKNIYHVVLDKEMWKSIKNEGGLKCLLSEFSHLKILLFNQEYLEGIYNHGIFNIHKYEGDEMTKLFGGELLCSIEKLHSILNKTKSFTAYIETEKLVQRDLDIVLPVSCIAVIDWKQTIEDLEKRGKIKITLTDSVMAVDNRKFWFVDDNPKWAIDVDCLGTALHEDTNSKVIDLWNATSL
ncbi:MAG TPA: hypothetical protein PKD85_00455 [Saprospiraceae bacterium]|nr:hypothetical protein [Saprospiraceae bacterium]